MPAPIPQPLTLSRSPIKRSVWSYPWRNSLGERQLVDRAYVDEEKSKMGCIRITGADPAHRPTGLRAIQAWLVAVAPDGEILEHTNKVSRFKHTIATLSL